jgi:hypothetical protein
MIHYGNHLRRLTRSPVGLASHDRRQMKKRFHRRRYRQRKQIESVISRNKRRLGRQLRIKRMTSQERDCQLQVLVHDLMILT